MILVQIVTGLPPLIDGIGDYALQLARQLRLRHGILSSFVVCDPTWVGSMVDGFLATKIETRTKTGLFDGIEKARAAFAGQEVRLLVHSQPYGYAKRGAPLWLANACEEWDKREPRTLITVFHELKVTGAPPWSSGFWVAPFQKWIAIRLGKLGMFRYTNTEENRSRLESWGVGRMPLLFNCSSTIEPLKNPRFAERRRHIIVFGRAHQRRLAYERGGAALGSICKSVGIERIIDIGAEIPGFDLSEISGIPIHRCGILDAVEISEWMSKSLASFICYTIQSLGKSTIYSVSCAHGTIPFIFDDQPKSRSCPGFTAGVDFIPVPRTRFDSPLPPLESLSQMIFDAYQGRASWVLADEIAKALQ